MPSRTTAALLAAPVRGDTHRGEAALALCYTQKFFLHIPLPATAGFLYYKNVHSKNSIQYFIKQYSSIITNSITHFLLTCL
jgi:hypothetical protein